MRTLLATSLFAALVGCGGARSNDYQTTPAPVSTSMPETTAQNPPVPEEDTNRTMTNDTTDPASTTTPARSACPPDVAGTGNTPRDPACDPSSTTQPQSPGATTNPANPAQPWQPQPNAPTQPDPTAVPSREPGPAPVTPR